MENKTQEIKTDSDGVVSISWAEIIAMTERGDNSFVIDGMRSEGQSCAQERNMDSTWTQSVKQEWHGSNTLLILLVLLAVILVAYVVSLYLGVVPRVSEMI